MRQDTLPQYHFLFIAPTLVAEWLFDAARQYWEHFRPTIISDARFLQYVPEDATVAVTVVARRDSVDEIGVEIAQALPDALFDPVSDDLFDDMRATLNQRASLNQPFGVPLRSQPAPSQINPTPGSLLGGAPPPTRAPAGFVTQTPTETPAAVPSQSPDA